MKLKLAHFAVMTYTGDEPRECWVCGGRATSAFMKKDTRRAIVFACRGCLEEEGGLGRLYREIESHSAGNEHLALLRDDIRTMVAMDLVEEFEAETGVPVTTGEQAEALIRTWRQQAMKGNT
jgi:hypothetical protein